MYRVLHPALITCETLGESLTLTNLRSPMYERGIVLEHSPHRSVMERKSNSLF